MSRPDDVPGFLPDQLRREEPFHVRAQQEMTCRAGRLRERGGPVAQGDRSFYRPGELLISNVTRRRYANELERRAARTDRDFGRATKRAGIDLQRVYLDPGTDVLDLAEWIRRDAMQRDDGVPVVVGANYCWRGEPKYHGGPGGEPSPVSPREMPRGKRGEGYECDVATLDTGVVPGLPQALLDRLRPDRDDDDVLDVDGDGVLESQNGHGSFVAGVVHQLAPELMVDPGRVLDSTGLGDDATVTRELLETGAPVINLSLGGYTEDDRAPVGLTEALRVLLRTRLVVAAAGNNASERPFWPAALKGVIAVAAYDSRGRKPRPATFSNFGQWVDVCAPGCGLVSTFATFPDDGCGAPPVFDGWARWDGTSFAAPQVAAALAQQMRAGKSNREAFAWLLDEACTYVPELARYGLVFRPERNLL